MNEPRATRYQRVQRRARTATVLVGLVVLAVSALTPLGAWLVSLAERAAAGLPAWSHPAASLGVFVCLFVAVWELSALPVAVMARPGRQVSAEPGPPWIATVMGALLRGALLVVPAAFLAAVVVLLSSRAFGAWWWAGAGPALGGLLAAALRAGPSLLTGLSGARPLPASALRTRLEALARRAGVAVAEFRQIPSGSAFGLSALVGGAGSGRQVFVSRDLLGDWTPDEVEVVVAHELGHCVRHDAWRAAGFDTVVIVAGLGLAEAAGALIGPPRSGGLWLGDLPHIALVAGTVWLALTPLRHAQSRRHERRADAFALALTGSADAFARAIRRLGAQHLADERPRTVIRWLFARHPSVAERLGYAERYRRRQGPRATSP